MFFLKHPTTLEVLGVLRHPASEQGQQLRGKLFSQKNSIKYLGDAVSLL